MEKEKYVCWAQLRKIAILVNKMFKPTKTTSADDWMKMMNDIMKEEMIIKKPYGGTLLKTKKALSFVNFVFVFSCILIIIIFIIGVKKGQLSRRKMIRF